jgi:hypothetical protein
VVAVVLHTVVVAVAALAGKIIFLLLLDKIILL